LGLLESNLENDLGKETMRVKSISCGRLFPSGFVMAFAKYWGKFMGVFEGGGGGRKC